MYPRPAAGDSFEFSTVIANYPASDGWTLTHRLVPQSTGDPIEMEAAADGDDYLTTVTTAQSSGWTAGVYSVYAYVTFGSERHMLNAVELSDGRLTNNLITILENPAELDTVDTRSHARKMVEKIDTFLESGAAIETADYTIKDRQRKYQTLEDLLKAKDYYKSLVDREDRAAAGLSDIRSSYVRFVRV